MAVVPARNPSLSHESQAPAPAHPGCLRAGTSRMVFSVHGASQESHLHPLVKAQLGFHSLPQGTDGFTKAACRQAAALRNMNVPWHSPHLQHSRSLSHRAGTNAEDFFPAHCPQYPLIIGEQRNRSRNRKPSHKAGKKREPTNEQVEAVNSQDRATGTFLRRT